MNKKYKRYWLSVICIIVVTLIPQFIIFRIPSIFDLSLNKGLYDHASWVLAEPKVLLMGSSHCNHNINPFLIEDMNGLVRNDVINIGVDAGTPFEMYTTYIKNKDKFKNVSIVYYTLEPWIISEKYYRFKSYEQIKLGLQQWRYIAKEYPSIDNMYFLPSKIFAQAYNLKGKSGTNQGFDPLQHHQFNEMSVNELKTWFEPVILFPISDFQLYHLNKLKELVETDGKIFVIVLTPAHASWFKSYRQLEYIDDMIINKINNHISSVKVIGSLNPVKYDLVSDDFADHNHLSSSGADKFTQIEFESIYSHRSLPSIKMQHLYNY
jgi:hypothetical protein